MPFARLIGDILYVNKGLQSTVMTTWQCHDARFMLQHNNDSMTV